MVQGTWVGVLLPIYFIFYFFCFLFFIRPMSASITWVGIEGFTLFALIPFLLHSSRLSFFLLYSLAIDVC